jgi:C4-dicarboxylate-specific signal transduction histidine kinase
MNNDRKAMFDSLRRRRAIVDRIHPTAEARPRAQQRVSEKTSQLDGTYPPIEIT